MRGTEIGTVVGMRSGTGSVPAVGTDIETAEAVTETMQLRAEEDGVMSPTGKGAPQETITGEL